MNTYAPTSSLSTYTLPINSNSFQPDLAEVGGKGANLIQLAVAGFPVPKGFIIAARAYQTFVHTNRLQPQISAILTNISADDPEILEAASQEIRFRFSAGTLPDSLRDEILKTYHEFGSPTVAVRSSATAEDLPDMSFAGQQDTFLNIIEETALVEAVIKCWSSLWTARAIGYRTRNHIDHDEVSLSVVVQEMVQSETSGILFTANPLSGNRFEYVIDASIGLGEAVVSGKVDPDSYIVDITQRKISQKAIGEKAIAIHSAAAGGVTTERINAAAQQAISDQQIFELTDLGKAVASHYQFPQDIEWAYNNGHLYLLQSRPITSLFPIPDRLDPNSLQATFSFGAIQGILDPMTPLGQDAIRLIFAGGAELFNFHGLTPETQGVIKIGGERLWGNMTPILRHPIGSRLVPRFFGAVDSGIVQALAVLKKDPALGWGSGRLRLTTFRRIMFFYRNVLTRVFKYLHHPENAAQQVQSQIETEIHRFMQESTTIPMEKSTLQHRVELVEKIREGFPFAVPKIFTAVVGGLIPLFILTKLATHLAGSSNLALEVTRGMPNNVTTNMDLFLWETAQMIRADTKTWQHFQNTQAETLTRDYLAGNLPPVAQEAISHFMERYGMRGIGEIDLGRPRWVEDPTHIVQVIQSYLQIEDPQLAPPVVFKRGEAAAQAAVEKLETLARSKFPGKLRARVVRWCSSRVRALAGIRESPKFYIIQMMHVVRQGLLASGSELVKSEQLEHTDDLFYLYFPELQAFARGETRDWKTLIRSRRAVYQRECLRTRIPRVLLSDGRAFYEGVETPADAIGILHGSPVSPGIIEGNVRVVLNPQNANLLPGEILVCPGTDPAWTPLFLVARGLVMEVGGIITHGAIVAREYGIPAIVGVHEATTRLKTGQRIRVDGSTGQIVLLSPQEV